VDVVIYLSVPLGFYLVFRVYEKMDRLDHDLTKIVRYLALREGDGGSAMLPPNGGGPAQGDLRGGDV
jgi:hypothetical protein